MSAPQQLYVIRELEGDQEYFSTFESVTAIPEDSIGATVYTYELRDAATLIVKKELSTGNGQPVRLLDSAPQRDAVKAAVALYTTERGTPGAVEVKKILEEFGAKRVSDLKDDQLAGFVARLA